MYGHSSPNFVLIEYTLIELNTNKNKPNPL